jgi:hypothetical protein
MKYIQIYLSIVFGLFIHDTNTRNHARIVRFLLVKKKKKKKKKKNKKNLRAVWACNLNALITQAISRVSIVADQHFICLRKRKLAVLGTKSW